MGDSTTADMDVDPSHVDVVIDWIGTVMPKAGLKPREAADEKRKALQRRKEDRRRREQERQRRRRQAGYEWHDVPDIAASKVGARMEFGADDKVKRVRLSGRPSNKHGASQGQHATAYAATRETVVSATVGRDEEDARTELAYLFELLLTYPAFNDPAQPAPDAIRTRVEELADEDSDASRSLSLEDLSRAYLEIRDALPGASLNTGITGTTALSSRSNVVGKGEGSTLSTLRSAEADALAGEMLDDDAAVAAMLKLYDKSSELAAALEPADIQAQRTTFLLTIAQAFPALFGEVEARLVDGLAADQPKMQKAFEAAAAGIRDAAERLRDGNKSGARPGPGAFTASVEANGTITFVGRSESIKDGGTMGDHTTAEQLMKDAASNLLMPGKKMPTNKELAASLRQLCTEFDPGGFAFFGATGVPQGDDQPFATPLRRIEALTAQVQAVRDMADQLDALDPAAMAGEDLIAEAAEAYMTLVDNRPTATHFGGVAGGHGEPTALAQLRDIEAGKYSYDDRDLLDTAFGLFDCQAAVGCADLFRGHNDGAAEDYLRQVSGEFLFFLGLAYPKVYETVERILAGEVVGGTASDTVHALQRMIVSRGGVERDDDTYRDRDTGPVEQRPASTRTRRAPDRLINAAEPPKTKKRRT